MARIAFNILTLAERLPLQVESLEIWGTTLLIGTNEGHMLRYQVPDVPSEDGRKQMQAISHEINWAKKPVTQLQVLYAAPPNGSDVLLATTDEHISMYTLPHVEARVQTLKSSKGATCFALSSSRYSPSTLLAVAIKKKILLYRIDPRSGQWVERGELPALPDTIKSMTFFQDHAAYSPSAAGQLGSSSPSSLQGVASTNAESLHLCVGLRSRYHWINVNLANPQASRLRDLWGLGKGSLPIMLLLDSMEPPQLVLGRDSLTNFFQKLDIDGQPVPCRKFGIPWSEPPIALAYCYPYLIALLSRCVEVRTIFETSQDSLVQSIPLKSVRTLAVRKHHIYLATQHCLWRLVPLPLAAQVDQLLSLKMFDRALELCEHIPASEFVDPSQRPTGSLLSPSSASDSSSSTFASPITAFQESQRQKKIESIKILHAFHLFAKGQQPTDYALAIRILAEHKINPLTVIGLYRGMLPAAIQAQQSYPIDIPDVPHVLQAPALEALIAYLLQIRGQFVESYTEDDAAVATTLQDNYNSAVDPAVIIDTCLFKAYCLTQPSLLSGLLRLGERTACHVKECEKSIGPNNYQLVLLYKSKRLHKQALDLLHRRASSADTMVSGLQGSVDYLKLLGGEHFGLIVEASEKLVRLLVAHVASEFPYTKLLPIFTEARAPGHELPADKVLECLKGMAPFLTIPYLEHVIHEQKSTNPDFHNELIFQYLDSILQLRKNTSLSSPASLAAAGSTRPGLEPGLLGAHRRKLLEFLENSQHYFPPKILSRFPEGTLFEERAILVAKLGQHETALDIYAHKLHDFRMAEEYCDRIFQKNPEEARDVYLLLLSVYLKQATAGVSYQKNPALQLLNTHHTRIDTAKALALLSPEIPLEVLWPFFQAVLRSNNKRRRNSQIIHSLVKSENLQVHQQLIAARSQKVIITEDKTCPKCKKRLGGSSVFFTRYPNGLVFHTFCAPDPNVCPVTGQVFNAPLDTIGVGLPSTVMKPSSSSSSSSSAPSPASNRSNTPSSSSRHYQSPSLR